jgi:hypothetical protein
MPPIPRPTTYDQWLPDGFLIRVILITLLGELRSFSVVLIKDDGTNVYDITRYDTMHGYVHRDILGKTTGTVSQGKIPLPDMPLYDALKHAKEDFKTNYLKYDQYYQTH